MLFKSQQMPYIEFKTTAVITATINHQLGVKKMVLWRYVIPVLVVVIYVAKSVTLKRNTRKRLPPGRRGWPVVGDSISWYNSVASSHPATFVQQQVLRKAFQIQLPKVVQRLGWGERRHHGPRRSTSEASHDCIKYDAYRELEIQFLD
ncbi:hypothetical protein Ccrd_017179 [Cynara cardunculus var. scolymus]|uniref:Uncharacterized protein n=1 Tax=Cynara cardunculus var. scolymus TaxID=59895 RepID=A0A103Y8K2_CYNCS|nr:hypothetical protein Ccrd_017179 [Cynara cardunculus var. scolymus]